MIGLIFVLTIPAAVVGLLFWLVVAGYQKSWLIAGVAFAASAIVIAPLFFGPELIHRSWNYSIAKFDEDNTLAVRQVDLAKFDYSPNHGFYRMDLLPIPNFKWHCEQHIAAPQGVFSGFSINKIPHVYVNKIRHGAKGVAWVKHESMLPTEGEFEYEYSGVDSWYIWSF